MEITRKWIINLEEQKNESAKTRPKNRHNYRENSTLKRTTPKKTLDSRELALWLLWNNSGNTENSQFFCRQETAVHQIDKNSLHHSEYG
jgi:hypothetical protein